LTVLDYLENFDVSLTVHHSITLTNDQLDAPTFNAFITILYMYMFRSISCLSSGGQIVLINIKYFNLLQYTIRFDPNNFNLTVHRRHYTSVL